MSSLSEQTLLITGANGFVAGHIIKVALEKGYKVKGAVRTDSSAAHLKATFPTYSSQLSTTIVKDITDVESFKDAFGPDVTGVIHSECHCSPATVPQSLCLGTFHNLSLWGVWQVIDMH